MVKRLLKFLRRWRPVEAGLEWLSELLPSWPDDEFDRFSTATAGISWPPGVTASSHPEAGRRPADSIAPGNFEIRFMKLQAEGRFDEMWEMVAVDAQRAWGGREAFIREMPRVGDDTELLNMEVVKVSILESWTDLVHRRAYHNVAKMVMRYRVRQRWREWTFDREVHLVPGAGGWRTLCYPTKAMASGAAGTR